MTLLPISDHLTVTNPRLEAQAAQTHAGMAHFAGTGPENETCRLCAFFNWKGAGGWTTEKGKYGGGTQARTLRQVSATHQSGRAEHSSRGEGLQVFRAFRRSAASAASREIVRSL